MAPIGGSFVKIGGCLLKLGVRLLKVGGCLLKVGRGVLKVKHTQATLHLIIMCFSNAGHSPEDLRDIKWSFGTLAPVGV